MYTEKFPTGAEKAQVTPEAVNSPEMKKAIEDLRKKIGVDAKNMAEL